MRSNIYLDFATGLNRTALFAMCFLPALGMMSQNAHAGGFLLAPTRIIFEGGSRAQEVTVMNQTNAPQTYRIRLEDRRLRESGEFDVITDPADPTIASPMIRLSARQVVVPPQTSATVRVLLRKPASLLNGEYRTHLVVTELPSVAPAAIETDAGDGITTRITTILGISIPILVRSGETSARLIAPALKRVPVPDHPELESIEVRLALTGNRSAFVDLRIISTRQRRAEPIYTAKAVAIYAPVNAKIITLSLSAEQTARLRAENVVLQYQEVNKDGVAVGSPAEMAF